MERIDLFDGYIRNQLSEKELSDFNLKLTSDKDFAQEFEIYLLGVDGIIKEAEQDDIEFGRALKSISKNDLLKILGREEKEESPIDIQKTNSKSNQEKVRKPFHIRPWVWQVMGCAAVVGLAIFYVAEMERTARNSTDNALYYGLYNYSSQGELSRGAESEEYDLAGMSDEELKAKLPEIVEQYENSIGDISNANDGTILVMAYIRLHDRKKAKELLEELISTYQNDEYFDEDVRNWKTILSMLQ